MNNDTSRIDAVRKARSLVDLLSLVDEIKQDIDKNKSIVSNIIKSLSQEISFDTRDNKPVRVAKWVIPKVSAIKKHQDVLNALYQNAEELDAVVSKLKQAFSGTKAKEALSAVLRLREEVDDKLNDAFDALAEIAQKHLPLEFQNFSDLLERYLLNNVAVSSYDESSKLYYVALGDNSSISFSCYFGYYGLVDDTGFKHLDFYIVATAIVDKNGNMTKYINAFPEFNIPGSYPVGKEVTTEHSAMQRVDMLLAAHKVAIEHKQLAFPISNQRAQSIGVKTLKGVAEVAVSEDKLVVVLQAGISEKIKQDIVASVIARLRSIVGTTNKVSFKYNYGKVNGKIAIQFVMTNSNPPGLKHKQSVINLGKLEELAYILDLTEQQVNAVKFALMS